LSIQGLLGSCPLFKATFYETLRLYSSSFVSRKVTSTLTLGESEEEDSKLANRDRHSYQLRAGEYVGVPQSLLNSNPADFSDPEAFKPTRFLPDSEEKESDDSAARLPKDENRGTSVAKQTSPLNFAGILPFEGPKDAERKSPDLTEQAVMAFTASVLVMWKVSPADFGPWEVPKRKEGSLVFEPAKDIRVNMKLRF
jgi:hypothetical protein